MTDNSALVRLVTPPATPIDARGHWTDAENALGMPLPADYKRLVETYGWGEFCDYLNLRTPFVTREHNGLDWQRGSPSGTPERDRERYPYPLHPAAGGLLVWRSTIDADRLCWLTDGAPESWPVVVWSRDGWYETHPMGAAAFVEAWAGARLDSRLLVDMEPDLAPWFNAFRPRTHRCLWLSEGSLAHNRRLVILRQSLAPTVDRGSWRTEDGAMGQDHFATVDTDWLLTYDMSRPHQIRISFPPEDSAVARQRLFAAVHRMRCEVLRITASDGTSLSARDAFADEDA